MRQRTLVGIFATSILALVGIGILIHNGPNPKILQAMERFNTNDPIVESKVEPNWYIVKARHVLGNGLDVLTVEHEGSLEFGQPVFISHTDTIIDKGDKIMLQWTTYDAIVTGWYDEAYHRRLPTALYVYGSASDEAEVVANQRRAQDLLGG